MRCKHCSSHQMRRTPSEPSANTPPPSLYKVPTYSTRAGATPRAPGGARHGSGNKAVTSQPRTGQSTSYGDVKPLYGGAGGWDRRGCATGAPRSANRQEEVQHRHTECGSHTRRDKGEHNKQGGGAQQGSTRSLVHCFDVLNVHYIIATLVHFYLAGLSGRLTHRILRNLCTTGTLPGLVDLPSHCKSCSTLLRAEVKRPHLQSPHQHESKHKHISVVLDPTRTHIVFTRLEVIHPADPESSTVALCSIGTSAALTGFDRKGPRLIKQPKIFY